jgi:hypothetical protein
MGTAASVPGREGFHELPGQQHDGGRSRRSALSSNARSTRGNRSVRAMALMNHSRQENSYMNADSIHLIARSTRRADSEEIEFPKQFVEMSDNVAKMQPARAYNSNLRRHEPTLASVPSVSNLSNAQSSSKTRLVDLPSSNDLLLGERSSSTILNHAMLATTPKHSPKHSTLRPEHHQPQQPDKGTILLEADPNLPSLKLFRGNLKLTLDVDHGSTIQGIGTHLPLTDPTELVPTLLLEGELSTSLTGIVGGSDGSTAIAELVSVWFLSASLSDCLSVYYSIKSLPFDFPVDFRGRRMRSG